MKTGPHGCGPDKTADTEVAMPVLPTDHTNGETQDVSRILKLEVPVIVRLARRQLPLKDVLRLAHGSILELDRGSEEPMHLMINDRVIGEGEAVKVGEHFGLRVTGIGDVRDRLGAMRK